MLFLPAAALCWLGSALAAMATQLVQDLTLTRREGERVSISCGTRPCANWKFWYQKKDTETYKAIIWVDTNDGEIRNNPDHPQIRDFSISYSHNSCELKINNVQPIHSASYYCGCWKSGGWIFGSGTKLYVTGDPVVKPLVSVYPAASSAQRDRKGFLLCLASGMFPPEVQISWTRLQDGGETDLTSEEQLELREPNRTASILLVDQDQHNTSRYSCSVKHQGGTVEATTQEFPAAASCPPQSPDQEDQLHHDWSFQSLCRVKLLLLLYSVLIVKSLVFCCGLMVLRTKGPTTS